MANLEELLKKVSEIVVKEKTQQEEKRKRGENFNIFKVLGLSTSEVRLHSAFLAELLNPKGEHGLGSKFLEAFVDDIVSDENKFPFECESAKVYVELDIGPIRNDETDGGRIDIYIQDANKQTIVVENKIYAGDQFKQMLRYYNYVTKNEHLDYEKNQFRLLYLTLDEHVPSPESTGGDENVENSIKCINYKDNILTWLERCIELSALYPAIREIISQYVINIKQIMNIMSEENKKELVGLLSSNMSAAVSILELESEIRKEVRREYINKVLTKIANKNGFVIDDKKDDFINMRHGAVITFNYNEKADGSPLIGNFVLRWYGNNSNSVYYGIMVPAIEESMKVDAIWPQTNDKFFPYGFCWFADSGNNCHWDRNSVIVQMQKEIEMDENQYPEGTIIAKEIDNQLKLIKNRFISKFEETSFD